MTNPPDRRKHGYRELEKKLNDHTTEIEHRLERFFIKALAAFAVLGITSAGSLLGFGIVLQEQKKVDARIQEQRFDAFKLNCEQQNTRHDRAIIRAENLLPPPGRRTVVLLVNELQPYTKSCVDYAKARVKGAN